MSEVLTGILQRKREEVERRRQRWHGPDLEAAVEAAPTPRGFARRLSERSAEGPAVIAEIKRASPSAGAIWPELDAASVARDYEAAGAACLSVLTDGPGFRGEDQDLVEARAATELPVLRKDFLIDTWQVIESRCLGADCVLLIVAALDDERLRGMSETAFALGMDVLVEVHDAEELDRALALDEACLLGINNRDLKVMRTDLATSERLAARVPEGRLLVSESGIASREDVERLSRAGLGCFLVGEGLIRTRAPGSALAGLIG